MCAEHNPAIRGAFEADARALLSLISRGGPPGCVQNVKTACLEESDAFSFRTCRSEFIVRCDDVTLYPHSMLRVYRSDDCDDAQCHEDTLANVFLRLVSADNSLPPTRLFAEKQGDDLLESTSITSHDDASSYEYPGDDDDGSLSEEHEPEDATGKSCHELDANIEDARAWCHAGDEVTRVDEMAHCARIGIRTDRILSAATQRAWGMSLASPVYIGVDFRGAFLLRTSLAPSVRVWQGDDTWPTQPTTGVLLQAERVAAAFVCDLHRRRGRGEFACDVRALQACSVSLLASTRPSHEPLPRPMECTKAQTRVVACADNAPRSTCDETSAERAAAAASACALTPRCERHLRGCPVCYLTCLLFAHTRVPSLIWR